MVGDFRTCFKGMEVQLLSDNIKMNLSRLEHVGRLYASPEHLELQYPAEEYLWVVCENTNHQILMEYAVQSSNSRSLDIL